MTLVTATCARCGATLAPGFGRLRCPRLTACGYRGIVENRTAAEAFRVTQMLASLIGGRGPRGPTPVAAA